MTDDIVTRLRAYSDDRISTHHADCWHTHQICAIHVAADEIETLRRLCSHMATLLDDCRPYEASIAWVMARLDTLEEWHAYREGQTA